MSAADAPPVGPNPSGLCLCGCGEPTPIAPKDRPGRGWIKGEPIRYLPQHHTRPGRPRYIVNPATGCWDWQWAKMRTGYGALRHNSTTAYAHRVYYEQHVGPIPEGHDIHHLCHNRACVNPDHLEPIDRSAHGHLHYCPSKHDPETGLFRSTGRPP